MSKKYDELMEKYSDLFRERNLPASQTCMCWGICCGEGWYDLLSELCEKMHKLFTDNGLKGDDYPIAVQVKEKFATLRFYMRFPDAVSDEVIDEVNRLVAEAEKKSEITCDVCGKPGTVTGTSWIATRCEEHIK